MACTSHGQPEASLSCTFVPNAPFMATITCDSCDIPFTLCMRCPRAGKKTVTSEKVLAHIRQCHPACFEAHFRTRTRTGVAPAQRSARANNSGHGLVDGCHPGPDFPDNGRAALPPSQDQLPGIPPDFLDVFDYFDDNDDLLVPQVPGVRRNTNVLPLEKASDITASCRQASKDFFFRDRHGQGLEYLVAKAQFGSTAIDPNALDQTEVKMFLQTAELAALLSVADREKLARYTETVCEVVKRQSREDLAVADGSQPFRPWAVKPITTAYDMRRQMKNGSKDSVMNTVPRVNVVEVGDHAVSLLSDCLQDLAGHGFPLNFLSTEATANEFPVRGISTSGICKKLFDIQGFDDPRVVVAEYNVGIFEWSDDFEANTSLTKSNRGSVWVKTGTFIPPETHRHLMAYTYPLAMGPKNKSHEEAELILAADLERLSSVEGLLIYSKLHKGLIRIRGKLISSLQDQPERRGENHLAAHAATLHKRWGWSFPWADFEKVLKPCATCRATLFDMSVPWVCRSDCPDCTNFAHPKNHPLLLHDHGVGGLCPVGPFEIDYSMLADAVLFSHDSIVSGDLEPEEADSWLKVHCIKDATRESILEHAEKCKEFNDIMADPNSSAVLKAAVTREKEENPLLYERWPLPAMWERGVHLHQHPDVPMHLLCLGIVKSVLIRVDGWLTKQRKGKPFCDMVRGSLESIQRLNLSWCVVLPYKGGKFGGLVSENFLGMSRLLNWFYSQLGDLIPEGPEWTEPTREMSDWTGKDCKKWLSLRGLNTKGNAKELRERASDYRQSPVAEQPPVVRQFGGPVTVVQDTLVALDAMMSWLMVEQIDDNSYYTELERKIRIFLSLYADMDARLTKLGGTPTWLTRPNFLSLLNLPETIRRFGPIRNLWEGFWMGEGILRFIKPDMIHGLRKYWQRSTMNSLMRKKGMKIIVGRLAEAWDDSSPDSDGEENDPSEAVGNLPGTGVKLFHCYKGTQWVDGLLRNGRDAISAVVVDNVLGLACQDYGETCFVPLTRVDWHSSVMTLDYFEWERETLPPGVDDYSKLDVTQIMSECLLLPLMQQLTPNDDDNFVTSTYAVIDRRHRALDRQGTFRQ
jgi:hypothetical protein